MARAVCVETTLRRVSLAASAVAISSAFDVFFGVALAGKMFYCTFRTVYRNLRVGFIGVSTVICFGTHAA